MGNVEVVLVWFEYVGVYFINGIVVFFDVGGFYDQVLVYYFGVEFNCCVQVGYGNVNV